MSKIEKLELEIQLERQKDAILENITEIIATHLGVNLEALRSKSRAREIVSARHLYCYIATNLKNCHISLMQIGLFIGRDHCTVMHSKKTAADLMEFNKPFQKLYRLVSPHFNLDNQFMTDQQRTSAIDLKKAEIKNYQEWLVANQENPYRHKVVQDLRSAKQELEALERPSDTAA